ALNRLLGDPGLRARLGTAGRDRVLANFTWARAAEGTVAHYREAIARAARTAPSTGSARDGLLHARTGPRGGIPDAAPASVAAPPSAASATSTSDTSVSSESRATC
ncbi:glycosyltransferase family 1 protein, partial [Streptomyces rubradiris]